MVKAIYTFGFMALISAVYFCSLCIADVMQYIESIDSNPKVSILDSIKQADGSEETGYAKNLSPLIKESRLLASHLNPPQPEISTSPVELSLPFQSSDRQNTVSFQDIIKLTPQFTLIATSYYPSRPDESLALITEPGSGSRWVRQGQKIGHFVLESIKDNAIVYRAGSSLEQMEVDTKANSNSILASERKNSSQWGIFNNNDEIEIEK